MHEAEKLNLDQIESFLKASEGIRFEGESRQQVYHWIEQVLRQQQYAQQGRAARGLLRRYLGKMTGLSRAQVTRLIARYRAHGELQPVPYRQHRFPQRYSRADVELLATVDAAHESLSGPATYLYQELSGWAHKELGLHSALVTGDRSEIAHLQGRAEMPREKHPPPTLIRPQDLHTVTRPDFIDDIVRELTEGE